MILLLACADPRPETVVLVVMDTVRADAVDGPAFAALAAQGTRFDRAYAAAPWTFPSHGALFTGLPPEAAGCTVATLRCNADVPLIAERYRDAGYATLGITNNPWVTGSTGLTQGLEELHEVFRGVYGLDRAVSRYVDPAGTGLDDAGAARSVGILDRWLDVHEGERAFVFVNLIEPHYPYDPPEAWRGRRRGGGVLRAADRAHQDAWFRSAYTGLLSPQDVQLGAALYREEVDYVDDRVGALVAALARHGRGDALLVVTADHGEGFAEHEVDGVQLVDHQLSLYDELLHVPLVIRWPGVVAAGVEETRPVGLTDVAPLLTWALDRQGSPALLSPPDDRVLTAVYAPPASEAEVFADLAPGMAPVFAARTLRSVRRGDEKLIVRSDGRVELYDLVADPTEHTDLAATRPDRVDVLRAELPPEPAVATLSGPAPETEAALRALGYLP